MYKFLVLSILIAVTAATPGVFHGVAAPVAVATPHVVGPSGVSQQSRHDVINPGAITYTTSHVAPAVVATPVVHSVAVPAVRFASAATSRLDVRGPVGIGYGGVGLGGGSGVGGGLAGGVGGGLAGGVGGGVGGGYGFGGGYGHGGY